MKFKKPSAIDNKSPEFIIDDDGLFMLTKTHNYVFPWDPYRSVTIEAGTKTNFASIPGINYMTALILMGIAGLSCWFLPLWAALPILFVEALFVFGLSISPIDPDILDAAVVHDYLVGEWQGPNFQQPRVYVSGPMEDFYEYPKWNESAAIMRRIMKHESIKSGSKVARLKRFLVYNALRAYGEVR